MKAAKRTLCVILSLLTALCLFPLGALAAEDPFVYVPVGSPGSANYHYEIGGFTPDISYVVVIPASYNGYPVTKIRKEAFINCGKIEEVTVPASVTNVLDSAFRNCPNLKKVTFEGSGTAISASAFRDCSDLSRVVLPSALTSVPDYAFNGCFKLSDITIPSTVTNIGTKAFSSCRKMTSVSVPASVTAIGEEAFSDCTSLTEISVEPECTACKSVNGVLFTKDGKELLTYPSAAPAASYTVPDGTEKLSQMAFAKAANLSTVELAPSVKQIAPYAFSEASALKNIDLTGVETIETMAFAKCAALTDLTIPASLSDYASAFVACGVETVTIENGSKTICNGAFDSCKSLKNVIIPESVTKIEAGAFKDCTALTELTVPSTVTEIEKNAFFGIADSITLNVELGSAALDYAEKYSIDYTLLGVDVNLVIGSGETEKKLAYYKTEKLTADSEGLAVIWSSSNPKVVTVDENGNIKAVGKGSAVITAAIKGAPSLKATVTVTVTFTFWQKIVYFFRTLFGIN